MEVYYLFLRPDESSSHLISSWAYNTQQVLSVMNLLGKLLSWSSHSLLTEKILPLYPKVRYPPFVLLFIDHFIKVLVRVHLPKWNWKKSFLRFPNRNCSTPLIEGIGKKSLDCDTAQLGRLTMISTIYPHHVRVAVPSIFERAQIIFQRCDSVSKFCTHSVWVGCKYIHTFFITTEQQQQYVFLLKEGGMKKAFSKKGRLILWKLPTGTL